MPQYDNNMTGVLFVNDRKTSDKHPTRKGSCEINGVRYWVSGWDKTTKRGDTISLSFEPAKSASEAMTRTAQPSDAFDDDIPF